MFALLIHNRTPNCKGALHRASCARLYCYILVTNNVEYIYNIFSPYCDSFCQKLLQYGEKILYTCITHCWLPGKLWSLSWDHGSYSMYVHLKEYSCGEWRINGIQQTDSACCYPWPETFISAVLRDFRGPRCWELLVFCKGTFVNPTFSVRGTDVSRHNGGTSGAPLKPPRDDTALRALSSLRGLRGAMWPGLTGKFFVKTQKRVSASRQFNEMWFH